MAMRMRCGDVVAGCTAEVRGDTEEDVLREAAEHARTAHGLAELDEATLAAVQGAIRPIQ